MQRESIASARNSIQSLLSHIESLSRARPLLRIQYVNFALFDFTQFMMAKAPPKRISQLDSLRGLAALSVIIFHYFLLFKDSPEKPFAHFYQWTHFLQWTPLGLLWAGHQAVVLFFILSGFVLALMLKKATLTYTNYLGKRLLRLYLPYAAAIGIGSLLVYAINAASISSLGVWINQFWAEPVSVVSLLQHALVLGHFNADHYDFTIWSLVHEIRISLVFPLLMYLVTKTRWWVSLSIMTLLSVFMVGLRYAAFNQWGGWFELANQDGLTNYTLTFHYMLCFTMGALLAHHREYIKSRYRKLSAKQRLAFAGIALLLYLDGGRLLRLSSVDMMSVGDWPIMLGAAGLLVVAAFSSSGVNWLKSPLLVWLGRISYSLYLFHPLVLLAALHTLDGHLPLPGILLIAFIATFPLSELAWGLFEKPALWLSRRRHQYPKTHQGLASTSLTRPQQDYFS